MRKYTKKSLFTIMALSLICTMFNFTVLTQNVNAAETEKPNVDGLELNKTAVDNGDGTYDLQLEAYAEGEIKVVTKTKPLDIVLVLDQSGSMSENFGLNYYNAYYHLDTGGGFNWAVLESVQYQQHYYIKKNNRYIGVTYIEGEKADGKFSIFKDSAGNAYVPMGFNGPPIASSDKWETVQFYVGLPDYDTPVKMDSLKKSATAFVDGVVKDGGDHRIAVVGYANGDQTGIADQIPYLNTELFIGNTQYSQNGQKIDNITSGNQLAGIDTMYSQAFQSTLEGAGIKNIKDSLKSLRTQGATRSDLGMEMANTIFAKDPNTETDREKVVIMFTDGTPTETEFFSEMVANNAIEWASKIKEQGGKVYTVGVEGNLDTEADPFAASTSKINKYMQFVSSNYPGAKSLDDAGQGGDYTAKNFLSAADEETLLKMFDTIREEISSSSIKLDGQTKLVDYVSYYFKVTKETDIQVFTQDYAGKDASGQHLWNENLVPFNEGKVEYDVDTQRISVSGFDYSNEFIAVNGETKRGKRLVLKLKVKVKDGFIGGKNVPTNKNTAGIYDGTGNVVEYFEVPKVNCNLKFEATAKDKSVYVVTKTGHTADIFDADLNKEGVQYLLGENSYDFDGINNAFVDVVYEIKVDGKVASTYSVKAGETKGTWTQEKAVESFEKNTPFTIKAKVLHKGKEEVSLTDTASAQINVFTPVVTTEDSLVFKGERVDLHQSIIKTEWVCTNVLAAKPVQEEPNVSFGLTGNTIIINPKNHTMNETTMYSVKVINQDYASIDYTDYTKFVNENKHEKGHFKITVVEGELQIVKNINEQYSDKEELNAEHSFKFKIERRDEKNGEVKDTYFQTIQFSANQNLTSKSIILKGLSKGYYSVSEMSDWSWKYDEDVNKREDNYKGNGEVVSSSENSLIYIGDNDEKYTDGKIFFGTASNTVVNTEDISYPAITHFYGNINQKFIMGDVASAINKFTK